METTVTLDRAGRVLIPKPLRDALHLAAGDSLALRSEGGQVSLVPIRSESPMRKEQGVWVFRAGKALTAADTDEVLQRIRQHR